VNSEIPEANYHLMWKSCLPVRENDTKKVTMKVKRIVDVDMVYIVHHVKVFGEFQRHNISCIAFSGQII